MAKLVTPGLDGPGDLFDGVEDLCRVPDAQWIVGCDELLRRMVLIFQLVVDEQPLGQIQAAARDFAHLATPLAVALDRSDVASEYLWTMSCHLRTFSKSGDLSVLNDARLMATRVSGQVMSARTRLAVAVQRAEATQVDRATRSGGDSDSPAQFVTGASVRRATEELAAIRMRGESSRSIAGASESQVQVLPSSGSGSEVVDIEAWSNLNRESRRKAILSLAGKSPARSLNALALEVAQVHGGNKESIRKWISRNKGVRDQVALIQAKA